jgi:hypothetical protein
VRPLSLFSYETTQAVTLARSYIGSRFYLHDPPGKNNAFTSHPDISPELLRREKELEEAEPDVNPWACVILLVTCVALAGVTAVFVRHLPLTTTCRRADRTFPHSSLKA